ncbi:MAG: hypothetical protein JSV77_10890 [Dehalococcoidales bacterium]|nr:MAG: hypothetical protein JSV77_10890 [Dehalococcoidales bacterium]
MNKQKAITSFLEYVEQLPHLPLITDSDMCKLFGEEVNTALAEIDRFNQKEQICLRCQNRCCPVCGCELYAPEFGRCPIYNLRPVLCRLHFCHRFNTAGRSVVVELGDIFFECLQAADQASSAKVRLFESPPLARDAPELTEATASWVDSVRKGSLDPEYARKLICREAEKYQTPDTHDGTRLKSAVDS